MLPLTTDDADELAPACPSPVTASLDRLPTPGAWDALARNAVEPNPFAERWFLRPSFRHLGQDGTRLLTVRDGERLLGLFAVAPRRGYARMPVPLAVNWTHYHSFLGAPLALRGRERDFWRATLPALDALAPTGLVHLSGLVEGGPLLDTLVAVAREAGRMVEAVHREERALYAPHGVDAPGYYEATVRKKKRKELGRLSKRFGELGTVKTSLLAPDEDVEPWIESFLALEAAGWKGRAGSALASDARTSAFFRDMARGAHARGLLDFARLDLDGRPAAMLCTLLASAGGAGFSYKIAYDEALARFSPGVLLQIANLDLPSRRDLDCVDSCAVEDHPMINSLWAERRALVRVTLSTPHWRSRAAFRLARAAERGAERWRARAEAPEPAGMSNDPEENKA